MLIAGARDAQRILPLTDRAVAADIVVPCRDALRAFQRRAAHSADDAACRAILCAGRRNDLRRLRRMRLHRNLCLRNERLAADGAVLAFRQAGLRAGRILRRVDHFLVTERRDALVHDVSVFTGVGTHAALGAGRLLGHDAIVPRIIELCAHLRDARAQPRVEILDGVAVGRSVGPEVIVRARLADADQRPLAVVHRGAGRDVIVIPLNLAVVADKRLRLCKEGVVIVVVHRSAEAGDLGECLDKIAAVDEGVVRRDHAGPAAAAGQLHVPDGAGVHEAVHVLIEEERGVERVGVAGEVLDQVSLNQRVQIAVLIVVLAGLRIVAGIVAVGILRVDGVFKLLIVLADVGHSVLAAPLGALDIHRGALAGDEAAGLVILRVVAVVELRAVELQQVAAGDVLRLGQAGGVLVSLAVLVLGQCRGSVLTVAGVARLVGFFHVGDVDARLVDGVFLTDDVCAAIHAVVVQIHPVGAGRVRHAERLGKILEHLVAHERCVVGAGEQGPCLDLLAAGDQVGLAVEFDLVGLLLGVGEGGVAARLELRERTVIHGHAVLVYDKQLAGRDVGLAGIDKVSALCGRIVTRDVERVDIGRLCDVHDRSLLAVDENRKIIQAVLRIRQLGDVHGSTVERLRALRALQLDLECVAVLRRDRQGELAQLRTGRQEQILIRTGLHAGDRLSVDRRTDVLELFGRRELVGVECRCADDIGIMPRIEPGVADLRAAVYAEAVRRRRVQARGHAAGLRGHLQDLPGISAVAADLHAVVLSTGSRIPADGQTLLANIRHRNTGDDRRNDLILCGHDAIVIAHAADRHDAIADLGVVGIGNIAVNTRVAGLDCQLLSLVGGLHIARCAAALIRGRPRLDRCLGDVPAHEAALRADMVIIPLMALRPERCAVRRRAAGLAGGQEPTILRAGTGVDRLGHVGNAVIAEVVHLLADLLPAGDIVAGQEVHLLLGALDGHPAGVLRVLDVDQLAADRTGRLAILVGRQLVALRAAGLQRRGIDHTAVLAVVSGDRHFLAVGRDVHDQARVVLLLVGKREIGRHRIVDVFGLLAQIAANEIGHAVFGNGRAVLGHDACIGVVMAGEDHVDAGSLCRGRDLIMEPLAAALGVRVIRRLVDGQDLPHAGALRRVLLEPFAGCAQVGAVVDDGDVDIAVLHGVVVLARELKDIAGSAAAEVAIVLMVAERVDEVHVRERVVKRLLHLGPHGVVGAVVDIVARLEAEVDLFVLDKIAERVEDRDALGIRLTVTGHLRVAHDDEGRGVLLRRVRAEGVQLGPCTAVADLELIVRAGRQARKLNGVDISRILGGGETGERRGAIGRLPVLRALDAVLHDRLAARAEAGQPADILARAAALNGVEMDGGILRAGCVRQNSDLRRLGDALRADSRERADRAGFLGLHGIGFEQAVGIGLADLRAVERHGHTGGGTAVLFIDRDHAGHADCLRAGLDAVVCRQRQTHSRLGSRVGLAVCRGERDVGHRVRELVDRRVQTGVNLEGQCGQLALDRCRRLKVQRQHGLLKAGLGIHQFAGHAVGIGHRRLTDVIVEVEQRDVRGLDLAVRRDRQRIVAAERDEVRAADTDRGRVLHIAGNDKGRGLFDRVAERIGHGDRHGVAAVLERQTHGRIRVGIVRLEFLAVDLDDRCLGIDAGAVLTVHIVIRGNCFDCVGVDDGGAVVRERLAVDRHVMDDRVIQVIEVRAVDGAIVIEVDGAVAPPSARMSHHIVDLCWLIGQPEHTCAGDDAQRVLIILILPNVLNICRAVHPPGPVNDRGALTICALMRENVVFSFIVAAIPEHNVGIERITRRVFRCIDPDADLRGRALDLDLVAAVANIEVGVFRPVIRLIVIVQLHGIVAEAHLTALGRRRHLQVAAEILRDRGVRPQVIAIAVGAEDVRSRNVAVPVAREAVGCRELRRRRVVRVGTMGRDSDRRHIADVAAVGILTVVHKVILAPVVVRAGLALAVDGLKVHERHRQLADLHTDLRRLGAIVCVSNRDGRVHRAAAGTGHERVAVHVADVIIRHTGRLGLDRPFEVTGLIGDVHTVTLGNKAEIGCCAKVERHGRAAEMHIRDVRDLHARRALDGAVHKQTRRHIALIVLRGREQTVGVDRAALGVRDRPGHILRERGLAAVFIHADGRELDLAVGRVDRVVRGKGGMIEHAVTLRRGDQQQRAGDRALHTVGRAVADLKLRGALALGGAGSGTAAVEEDRIHHALRIQERNLLIDRHADRVRALAAVGQEGHDRAVRLDADAVARHEVRIPVVAGLSILDQIKRAGNRFQNVGAVHPGVTDGIGAVLQNRKIRLVGNAVILLNEVALHDEVTERLQRLHVVVVAVHGHDDVAAGSLGVVGSLQRGLFHAPGQIGRLVLAGRGRAAFCIVTVVRGLECRLRTRCDRRHKTGDLCIAFLRIQEDVRFRHAVDQRVIRLTHKDLTAGRFDGVYGVRSQRLRGNERQRHQDGQHKSPRSVRESGRFHDSHQLLFCSFLSKFVSSMCEKRRDEVFPSLLCALGSMICLLATEVLIEKHVIFSKLLTPRTRCTGTQQPRHGCRPCPG